MNLTAAEVPLRMHAHAPVGCGRGECECALWGLDLEVILKIKNEQTDFHNPHQNRNLPHYDHATLPCFWPTKRSHHTPTCCTST